MIEFIIEEQKRKKTNVYSIFISSERKNCFHINQNQKNKSIHIKTSLM